MSEGGGDGAEPSMFLRNHTMPPSATTNPTVMKEGFIAVVPLAAPAFAVLAGGVTALGGDLGDEALGVLVAFFVALRITRVGVGPLLREAGVLCGDAAERFGVPRAIVGICGARFERKLGMGDHTTPEVVGSGQLQLRDGTGATVA